MADFRIRLGVLSKYIGADENVIIPDGVTRIKAEAFEKCPHIRSVTMPDSVTEIGESAFYGCKGLKKVTLSANLTALGARLCYAGGDVEKLLTAIEQKDQRAFVEKIMSMGHESVLEHVAEDVEAENCQKNKCARDEREKWIVKNILLSILQH